eukprot:277718_1
MTMLLVFGLFIFVVTGQPKYFEAQESQSSCQKHAINNMFQKEVIKDCGELEKIKQTYGSVNKWLETSGFGVTQLEPDKQVIFDAKPERLLISTAVYAKTGPKTYEKTTNHIATIIEHTGKYYLLDSMEKGPIELGSKVKMATWVETSAEGIEKDGGKFIEKTSAEGIEKDGGKFIEKTYNVDKITGDHFSAVMLKDYYYDYLNDFDDGYYDYDENYLWSLYKEAYQKGYQMGWDAKQKLKRKTKRNYKSKLLKQNW